MNPTWVLGRAAPLSEVKKMQSLTQAQEFGAKKHLGRRKKWNRLGRRKEQAKNKKI